MKLRIIKAEPNTMLMIRVPAARKSDPKTSKAGAKDVKLRAHSQLAKLLSAYYWMGPMTAYEAVMHTDIPQTSCYWKRVSDLVHRGLLEDTGKTKMMPTGSVQRVCVITEKGREIADSMEAPWTPSPTT